MPPAGSRCVWLFVLDVIAGACVHYRVPHYLDWQSVRRPGRLRRVVGDGVLIGLVFASVPVLFGSGEPSVTPGAIDMAIWFLVLGAVGVINTMLAYACVAVRSTWSRRCSQKQRRSDVMPSEQRVLAREDWTAARRELFVGTGLGTGYGPPDRASVTGMLGRLFKYGEKRHVS